MGGPPEAERLEQEIASLREQVARVERAARTLADRVSALERREPVLPTVEIPPPAPANPTPPAPAFRMPPPPAIGTPPPLAPRPPDSTPGEGVGTGRTFEDVAWMLINRVGVVALFLGVGFFLKYAYDNDWIGPAGRVAIGILAGAALLGIGEWQQKKEHAFFGQGMTGGGIAVLYASFYAAHGFYHLIPAPTAFALMALVTATACAAAVRYRSLAIAVLALAGGFLTPPMLSTGVDRQLALFGYVGLLDVAALGLASYGAHARPRWRSLEILALAGTIVMLQGWAHAFYSPSKFVPTLIIDVLFLALFTAFPAVDACLRAPVSRYARIVDLVALVIAGAWFLANCWIRVHDYVPNLSPSLATVAGWLARHPLRAWEGLVPLGFAALQVGAIVLMGARARAERLLTGGYLALALAGLILVPPAQWSNAEVSVAWCVQIALLVLAARATGERSLFAASCALWVAALIWACLVDAFASPRTALFATMPTAAYLACAATAWLLRWATRPKVVWAWLTAAAMHLAILLALSAEVHAFVTRGGYRADWNAGRVSLSILWACYGVALAVGGFALKQKELRGLGIGLLAATAAKVFFADLATLPVVYRIFSFLGLGVLFVAGSYVYLRSQRQRRGARINPEGT